MPRMWIEDIHWSRALGLLNEYNKRIEETRRGIRTGKYPEGSKYILGSSKSSKEGYFGIYAFDPNEQIDGIFWEIDFKLKI